jgi:hypothetical protein
MASTTVILVVLTALAYAMRSGRHGKIILHHPYNNRYNDASAARDYSFRDGPRRDYGLR